MTSGTTRVADGWAGVLREKGRVAWTCAHVHETRDAGLGSAYVCAADARKAAELEARRVKG